MPVLLLFFYILLDTVPDLKIGFELIFLLRFL